MSSQEEKIEGALIPGNLFAVYFFSFNRLKSAISHMFGEESLNAWLSGQSGFPIPEDYSFGESGADFEDLLVIITFLHEQFHFRQLYANPIGFVLYLLQGQEYQLVTRQLNAWGKRAGSLGVTPKLPFYEHHITDSELEQTGTDQECLLPLLGCLATNNGSL